MYNRIILIGRLVAEPELRQTPSGTSVCSFRIAVQRSFAPRGGERQTDFFDIVAWQQRGEFVTRFFHKGNMIGVEGRLETREYTDRNNQQRRAYEVIADNLFFVESRSAASAATGRPSASATASALRPIEPVAPRMARAFPSCMLVCFMLRCSIPVVCP